MAVKEDIIKSLNDDLQLEHMARIQYLSHAEVVKGPNADEIINRIKEIAGDEAGHEEKFRTMIGDYLGGVPTMKEAQGHPASSIPQILDTNLDAERTSIEQYKKTYKMIIDNKSELPFVFEKLEHDLRHIIMEEQEHITELDRIKGV